MSLLTRKSNGSSFLSAISDFTSLFFPQYCLGCFNGLVKGEELLCTQCLAELPRTGYVDIEENPIKEKFIGRLPIKNAWAFLRFRKEGIVQHLLHQLKYNNQPEIGIRLGKLFGRELMEKGFSQFDLIIPLPLHSSRQKNRGYNQSKKFAEGLSSSLQIPVNSGCCARLKNTETQTRKNRSKRWENVEFAFQVTQKSEIEGKRILLVDDVITTGATLEACGLQLIDSGCSELSIACIAEAQ
jgi:ComF family protein